MSYKVGSKFTGKWHGPYVVRDVRTNGASKILDGQGIRVGLISSKFLKHYFP